MKNTFRPKLVTKPNRLQLIHGGVVHIINVILLLTPFLFGLIALYLGYFILSEQDNRYISMGVMLYGAGMVVFSVIKAPKRIARIVNHGAALTFSTAGISRKTIAMENEAHYHWSDIDKLVITPKLSLNSSNHNSQEAYNILVLFDNDKYSNRINTERKKNGKKPVKVNGLWHTTKHHLELTLDNTLFFRQPFQKNDLNELQRNIKAYTKPLMVEHFELIVHPVSSTDSQNFD